MDAPRKVQHSSPWGKGRVLKPPLVQIRLEIMRDEHRTVEWAEESFLDMVFVQNIPSRVVCGHGGQLPAGGGKCFVLI